MAADTESTDKKEEVVVVGLHADVVETRLEELFQKRRDLDKEINDVRNECNHTLSTGVPATSSQYVKTPATENGKVIMKMAEIPDTKMCMICGRIVKK